MVFGFVSLEMKFRNQLSLRWKTICCICYTVWVFFSEFGKSIQNGELSLLIIYMFGLLIRLACWMNDIDVKTHFSPFQKTLMKNLLVKVTEPLIFEIYFMKPEVFQYQYWSFPCIISIWNNFNTSCNSLFFVLFAICFQSVLLKFKWRQKVTKFSKFVCEIYGIPTRKILRANKRKPPVEYS